MADFVMPSLGADMERGVLVEWLVKPGDTVEKGQIIAVIETDKGAIEVEVFAAGVVQELLVNEGEDTPVGTVLARISEDGEPVPKPVIAATPVSSPPAVSAPVPTAETQKPRPQPTPPARPPAPALSRTGLTSPWARQLAGQRGVSLRDVIGTGPGGAIVGADVPERIKPASNKAAKASNIDAMRRAVARAMAKSKREIPHYYLGTEVDMTRALEWLSNVNASLPPLERMLPTVLLLKAVAHAIRKVPEVNGFWRDDALQVSEHVHLGVAVSLRGGGLVAPALHDVDKKSLADLMSGLTDLVTRARRGRLRGSEMTDATLTVTSMGDRGVERVDGIIYPPQVAIVGFGRVTQRPWAVNGEIALRSIMTVSLAGDHRAHDGHRGGLFLNAVAEFLSNPETL